MGGYKAMIIGFKVDLSDQQLLDQLGLKYEEEYEEWDGRPVDDPNDFEWDGDEDDSDTENENDPYAEDENLPEYVDDMEIDMEEEGIDSSNITHSPPDDPAGQEDDAADNDNDENDNSNNDSTGNTRDDHDNENNAADDEDMDDDSNQEDENGPTTPGEGESDANMEDPREGTTNDAEANRTGDDASATTNHDDKQNDSEETKDRTEDTKLIRHPDYPFYPYLPVATSEQQESLLHIVRPCCARDTINVVVFGYKIISGEAWATVDETYAVPDTTRLARSVLEHYQYLGRTNKTINDVGLLLIEHACSCT